jgi:hypothetical protein
MPTPTGAVVLLWKANLPPRQPQLAEVKDKVKADYVEAQRQQQFAALGAKIKAELASALKAGTSFDKAVSAAAASDKVKIAAKSVPTFKLSDQPRDLPPAVSAALGHLNAGEISDLQVNGNDGTLVYAAKKVSPKLDTANPRYAAMRAQAAAYFANITAGEYINQLVTREQQRTEAMAR